MWYRYKLYDRYVHLSSIILSSDALKMSLLCLSEHGHCVCATHELTTMCCQGLPPNVQLTVCNLSACL